MALCNKKESDIQTVYIENKPTKNVPSFNFHGSLQLAMTWPTHYENAEQKFLTL